ncbi:MAG: glycosyltransferase [Gammaproteobacteria bacterium]|nr:glycosyltransferase [Gammaproteobacteria bacterium]
MVHSDSQHKKNSDQLHELVRSAQQAKKEKNWEIALQLWDKCIQTYKEGELKWWRSEYANALMELGRLDEANQQFNQLKSEFPDFEGGYLGLAKLANKRSDWKLAIKFWGICIQLFDDGKRLWWHANYANALTELGHYEEAKKIYKKLSIEFPDFNVGFSGLAKIAQKQNDWEEANRLWSYCLLTFENSNPWWIKAQTHALINLNRYEDALETIGKIQLLNDDDPHVYELLCKVNFLLNDMQQCYYYGKKFIENYSKSPRGYYWCEKALINLGRFDEAADFHLQCPTEELILQHQTTLPDNYPPELLLPPLKGAGNDYSFIEEAVKEFQVHDTKPSLSLSVVIPVYNRAEMLAKTLAALVHQSYPHDLIEVIIADDGSSDHIINVLDKYKGYLNIRYVRQEDLGYRLSAVRNLGIKAARADYIFVLDCDVIPPENFIETFMNYFYVTDQAVLFGLRKNVSTNNYQDDDLLEKPELIEQLPEIKSTNSVANWQTVDGRSFDWRLPILASTNNLKETLFPFELFSGGIIAFPKTSIQEVGYFDEDFQHWGGEDVEFGYRLYNQGYYFIPIMGCTCFHQELPENKNNEQIDREAGLKITRPILQQKCPIPSIRHYTSNKKYQVPKVSIFIPSYNNGEYIKEAVDSVLKQTFTDLEVIICDDGSTDDTVHILNKYYNQESRVHWFSQAHSGIAAASNRAISKCRGMYIGQLDSDDMLEPGAVDILVNFLDKNNVGAVYSRYNWVDRSGIFMRKHDSSHFTREHLMVAMICTAFRMFRKRDWMHTSGYDESMKNAVDYDMMLKLSEVCNIAYIPELTYKYRYHGRNTSLQNHDLQEKNHIIAINNALNRMKLSEHWKVTSGSKTDRRNVKFLKI